MSVCVDDTLRVTRVWHMMQLTQAGKRLSPSDPDKSKAPSATLPVWDMMRMLWRGQIGLTARSAPPEPSKTLALQTMPLLVGAVDVVMRIGHVGCATFPSKAMHAGGLSSA